MLLQLGGWHAPGLTSCHGRSCHSLPALGPAPQPPNTPCHSAHPPPSCRAAAGADGGCALCLGHPGAPADWPQAADSHESLPVRMRHAFASILRMESRALGCCRAWRACHACRRHAPARAGAALMSPASPGAAPARSSFLVRQWIHQWGRFLLFVSGFYWIPVRGWANMRAAEAARCVGAAQAAACPACDPASSQGRQRTPACKPCVQAGPCLPLFLQRDSGLQPPFIHRRSRHALLLLLLAARLAAAAACRRTGPVC